MEKAKKFHDYLAARIQQSGEFRGDVVKEIINQRHGAENIQIPVRFGKQKGSGLTEMAAQKGKDRAGGENPGQVIDPVQAADGKGQDTGPVAELTAEIGSQDRDQRRQPPVLIIKYQ